MRGAKLIDLPVDEIDTSRVRVTPLHDKAVEIIKASVEEVGAIRDPIHVRKAKDGYQLIDGRHRLEAARQLGHETISAKVWECTLDQARLMEADANVSFTHMQPLDLAVSLAARKDIYEALHPETARGTAGALAKHGMQRTNLSFAEFVGDLVGLSPRQIRRIVSAGAALSSDQARWLRAAPKPPTMSDLQAISKITDDAERAKVCIALSNGEAGSVNAARKAYRQGDVEPAPKDPVEEGFQALMKAWTRAPMAARRRFLDHMSEDIEQMGWDRDE